MVPGSNMKTIRCFNFRKIDNWKKLEVIFMKSITYPYVAVRRWSKIIIFIKNYQSYNFSMLILASQSKTKIKMLRQCEIRQRLWCC